MALITSNSGGAVASWSISPTLPTGLSFNVATGDVTGTATAGSLNDTYTITATNAAGSDTCTFDIGVALVLLAPVISCPANQSLTVSSAMGAVVPDNTGGIVASWSISPALPAGLTMSTSTGVFSGTPSSAVANSTYTVTATNASGSDTCTFDIEVLAVPLSIPVGSNQLCGGYFRTSGGQAEAVFTLNLNSSGEVLVDDGAFTAGGTLTTNWLPASASASDYEIRVTEYNLLLGNYCSSGWAGTIVNVGSWMNAAAIFSHNFVVLIGGLNYHGYKVEIRDPNTTTVLKTLYFAYEIDAT